MAVPGEKPESSNSRPLTGPAPHLYPLEAAFVQDYPVIGANADGTDLWPCSDLYLGVPGSNSDCPTIGSPSIPLPINAIVVGFPFRTWALKNAPNAGNGYGYDAYTNGTRRTSNADYIPCGQIETWYEDDTSDSTDDLLQRVVVRQGDKIIYDTGLLTTAPPDRQ